MIDIGSIAYGPELERLPILRDLERLSQVLRGEPDIEPKLELAFVIPGSLGGPDFRDFKGSRRRQGGRTIIFIAVPGSVAMSESPIPELVDLAFAAISYAVDANRIPRSELHALRSELRYAAAQLGVDVAYSVSRGIKSESVSDADPESIVELVLVTPDRRAVGDAFDLEDALVEHLAASSAGYVDGNEVGDGIFTIFAVGRELPRLREAVQTITRSHWSRPGAVLRLLDRGRDGVETVIPNS